ncbi:hypothetical protein G6F32_015688 [Rhizopus arrhizus]|nr:hypothetical protein G6F32_015688 [Rhizopus arrhizus]
MRACSTYGSRPPPAASARASACWPRSICSQSQRARFCWSSSTGAPCASVRAAAREACSSINASRPSTGGTGNRCAMMRASRSASSHSAGRIQSSPDVAE